MYHLFYTVLRNKMHNKNILSDIYLTLLNNSIIKKLLIASVSI